MSVAPCHLARPPPLHWRSIELSYERVGHFVNLLGGFHLYKLAGLRVGLVDGLRVHLVDRVRVKLRRALAREHGVGRHSTLLASRSAPSGVS